MRRMQDWTDGLRPGLAFLTLGLMLLIPAQAARAADQSEPALGFNLVTNGSFEGDWYNTRGEVMGCPVEPRVTFGQADGIPDGWKLTTAAGKDVPPTRAAGGHTGLYAAEVPPKARLWQADIGYGVGVNAPFKAVPLRLSAYVHGGAGKLSVTLLAPLGVDLAKKESPALLERQQAFPAAEQWTRVVLDIPANEVLAAMQARGHPVGPISVTVAVEAAGERVLVDDVRLERPYLPAPYSLVPNPGFEDINADGQPAQWSPVKKSLRHVGTWYYVWRSWYHFMGVPRGANAVDELVVAAGKRSFRMNVAPGDEKCLESAAIPLNQGQPRRMVLRFDYNTYMLAHLIVQVVDQDGREVFFDHVVPGNTSGWAGYQKEFVPRAIGIREGPDQAPGKNNVPLALKSCRVRIGVRGVNGSDHDDINQWQDVNHAGVVWLDNVALMEVDSTPAQLQARGVKTFALDQEAPSFTVEAIDLGERLYGENQATVTLLNTGTSAVSGRLDMLVTGPFREDDPQKAGFAMSRPGLAGVDPAPVRVADQKVSAPFTVGADQRITVALPYTIMHLLDDWRSEYRVKLALDGRAGTDLTFGTWNQQVYVDLEESYLYPDETRQLASINFGVARPLLEKAKSVRVEVCRAADNAVVATQAVPDWPGVVAGFNLTQLPTTTDPKVDPRGGRQGDDLNFLQVPVDVSRLPIHPQDNPVRDFVVRVVGVDGAGRTLFGGSSPRFGRMEVHTEKLDPITSVAISPDNYLLVNGKPFFNRGHMQMQQNFGPSAFSHQPMDFKKTGFNTAGVGRHYDEKTLHTIWDQENLYVITQKIEFTGDLKPPMNDLARAAIRKEIAHPAIIALNYIEWEGAPTPTMGDDATRVQFAKDIKKVSGRPLWISAGWYSPTVDGIIYPDYIQHDFFAPENNSYFQPSVLDREIGGKKRAMGQAFVLNTYDNVFNDLPWGVERFEVWSEIIRGHTGYTIIGMPGDPSLFRGMNGEVKHIESFLFSKEKTPEVSAQPPVEHMVRARGGTTYIMATNNGPITGGDWTWNTTLKNRGVASHTGDTLWNRFHDYMKDYHEHNFKNLAPVTLHAGDKIVQYVMIPGGAKVDALALLARGNGDWAYTATFGNWDHKDFTDSGVRLWMARDMHQMFWGTTGYALDFHNPNLIKHVFTEAQFHHAGPLPAAGTWARLEIPIESIGLTPGTMLDGIGFVSKGDRVWWERTLVLRAGKEVTLCDGSVGIDPAQLKQVRFSVAGLKAGTKVNVAFEDRQIVAQDGYFEDDLSGEPGYQNLWEGIYGDKLGDTGYYGDGTFYNYNFGKVAARLYEVPR